jgi:hypothetical protein
MLANDPQTFALGDLQRKDEATPAKIVVLIYGQNQRGGS